MKKLIFGLIGAVALFGCGGGGSNGGGDSDTKARVAYLNASPDAGNLDFRLNDSLKASDVPYGSCTGFGSVKATDYDISISAANSSETLWSEAKSLGADTDFIVMGVGLRTPPVDNTQTPPVVESLKRLILSLGAINRETPTGNRARLLIVHALVRKAGFGTPTIDFRNPGDTPVISQTNIGFANTVSIDVDSGAQTFQVRQNGTEQVFVERNFTLAAGGVYVALVSGLEGEAGPAGPEIRLIPIPTRD